MHMLGMERLSAGVVGWAEWPVFLKSISKAAKWLRLPLK
jgi:hypothetical protein